MRDCLHGVVAVLLLLPERRRRRLGIYNTTLHGRFSNDSPRGGTTTTKNTMA
jgi:hypothetical protein